MKLHKFKALIIIVIVIPLISTTATSQQIARAPCTGCRVPYKRQINYNDTTAASVPSPPPPDSPFIDRKLFAIESNTRSNGAKLEVVLQVLAETQRSLLYIERKLREHDEASTRVNQDLRERILTLERKLQTTESPIKLHYSPPQGENQLSTSQPDDSPPEQIRGGQRPRSNWIYSTTARFRDDTTATTAQTTMSSSSSAAPTREFLTSTTAAATTTEESISSDSEEVLPPPVSLKLVASEPDDGLSERRTTASPKPKKTKKIMQVTPAEDEVINSSSETENATEIIHGKYMHISTGLLEQLTKHPRATLYTGENKTRESVYYHLDLYAEKGCADLSNGMARRIKSVDPYTTCVRVFLDQGCQGWSAAIYEGSSIPGDNPLNPHLTHIRSIGRCVENEFENALTYSVPVPNSNQIMEIFTKKEKYTLERFHIPDLIEFRSDDKAGQAVRIRDKDQLVVNYLRGYRGRLEFSEALINRMHLRSAKDLAAALTPTSSESSSSSSSSSEEKEGFGAAIPAELGGSMDEKYNLFKQSPENKRNWAEKTGWIHEYLTQNNHWVTVSVNFVYENDTALKPKGFAYYIDKFSKQLMYGYIEN